MLNIFRWLLGFVRFTVVGKFPERFINIVTKSGLSIWDTENKNGVLNASMFVRDYKNIRLYAKKSRVRLKIQKKSGLPFFIKKYKARVGVLIGLFIFVLIAMFMSNFVWTIDIVGLQTVSEAQLVSSLKENGLFIGTYKPSASFKTIARDTMLDIPDIGWMSINVVNSHASVELKEKAKSPKVADYHQPANVKAERDGLIVSINTSQGESYFESGSAVVKDQLLVSAVVEDMLGGVTLVRADAEVVAQTKREKTFSVTKFQQTLSFCEPVYRKELNIFSLSIPYSFAFADENDSLISYKTENSELFDTTLPLSVTTKTIYKAEEFKTTFTQEEAQETLLKYCALFESFELSDCIIKDREYKFYETDTEYLLDVEFICEEDIAYQQDINIDNAEMLDLKPTEAEEK